MAKTDAERSNTKYGREKADLERLGGKICRFHLPAAPLEALEALQEWGDIEDWREAISTILLALHAAGRDAALPFLVVASHEFVVSKNVARLLDVAALKESRRNTDDLD